MNPNAPFLPQITQPSNATFADESSAAALEIFTFSANHSAWRPRKDKSFPPSSKAPEHPNLWKFGAKIQLAAPRIEKGSARCPLYRYTKPEKTCMFSSFILY